MPETTEEETLATGKLIDDLETEVEAFRATNPSLRDFVKHMLQWLIDRL